MHFGIIQRYYTESTENEGKIIIGDMNDRIGIQNAREEVRKCIK